VIAAGLVVLVVIALAASAVTFARVRQRRLEQRRLRVYLEEQLTRRQIDNLTWATLRAMRQIVDDYQRSSPA
jgi:hypothetical protein